MNHPQVQIWRVITLAQDPIEDEQESKPSWTAHNSPQPWAREKWQDQTPWPRHWASPAVQPLSKPSYQAEKKTLQGESTFLSSKWLRIQTTNKLYPNPARTNGLVFFFGHESGKNVNLLRSWLVSFCDNCLSSLKPPTRCTSSLTEME